MAAVNLSTEDKQPIPYTETGIATTWQEFKIPAWCTHVTVVGENNAIYIATKSAAETPADGGAVGTHRFPIAAGVPVEVEIADDGDVRGVTITRATSLFIAAQSATVTVSLWLARKGC